MCRNQELFQWWTSPLFPAVPERYCFSILTDWSYFKALNPRSHCRLPCRNPLHMSLDPPGESVFLLEISEQLFWRYSSVDQDLSWYRTAPQRPALEYTKNNNVWKLRERIEKRKIKKPGKHSMGRNSRGNTPQNSAQENKQSVESAGNRNREPSNRF